MDYLTPGFRELTRKFGRLLNRLRIAAARRRLGKAEAELGLLGWQQADFDAETQVEVDKIKNFEREQSRLTNQGAEVVLVIRDLLEKRGAAARLFEETRQKLQAEKRAVADPIEGIQKQLIGYRKQEPQYERRIPALDREFREVQLLYTKLLGAERRTPQVRDDLGRLRDRTVAIPNEKADLRTKHMHVASEIKTLETLLVSKNQTLAALDRKIEELEALFSVADRELASEIKANEREKLRIAKENDTLERAKTDPYQQIGRVLADNSLAPLNQPHVLERVARFRRGILQIQSKIESSLEDSAIQDASLIRTSYIVWGSMVLGALLVAGAFLST